LTFEEPPSNPLLTRGVSSSKTTPPQLDPVHHGALRGIRGTIR
jgi:hypothetical protein